MYINTDSCRTTVSFFSEKWVLQCGLHQITELYWHLRGIVHNSGKKT